MSLEMIFKVFNTKADVDKDSRTVIATISTGSRDRQNEVLSPKGADFTNYEKNPVVLFGHRHDEPPVGKCLWIKRQGNKIIAKTEFATTDKANEVFELFSGGFLNAFSVGLIPKKYHAPVEDEIKADPELAGVWRIIDEWELLEYSVVAVPANADALRLAIVGKSISMSEQMLKEFDIAIDDIKPDKKENKIDIEPAFVVSSVFDVVPFVEVKTILYAEPYTDVAAEAEKTIKRIKGKMF